MVGKKRPPIDENVPPISHKAGSELSHIDPKSGPSEPPRKKLRPEETLDVPEASAVYTNDMPLESRKLLAQSLSDPKPENVKDFHMPSHLLKNVPGLKEIRRPRPHPANRNKKHLDPKHVHELYFGDDLSVYVNEKDGSLWCEIDPKNKDSIKAGVDRILEVAAGMGMGGGTLCLPNDIDHGMRAEIVQHIQQKAKDLGIGVDVVFGDPRALPPPPRPPMAPKGPALGPSFAPPAPKPPGAP